MWKMYIRPSTKPNASQHMKYLYASILCYRCPPTVAKVSADNWTFAYGEGTSGPTMSWSTARVNNGGRASSGNVWRSEEIEERA